jgi:hypothetical protein
MLLCGRRIGRRSDKDLVFLPVWRFACLPAAVGFW